MQFACKIIGIFRASQVVPVKGKNAQRNFGLCEILQRVIIRKFGYYKQFHESIKTEKVTVIILSQ